MGALLQSVVGDGWDLGPLHVRVFSAPGLLVPRNTVRAWVGRFEVVVQWQRERVAWHLDWSKT